MRMAQHLRPARGCDISRRRPGEPARGDDEPGHDVAIVNASCRRRGRSRARQRDDGLEPTVVILEPELAALPAGHPRSQAQTPPPAPKRTPLFSPPATPPP